MLEHQGLCATNQGHQASRRWMHWFFWCQDTLPISTHRSCHTYYQEVRTGQRTSPKNIYESDNIISLLGFCLNNNFVLFQGGFYEQLERAVMGLHISTMKATLFIENFGIKTLHTAANPLGKECLWQWTQNRMKIKKSFWLNPFNNNNSVNQIKNNTLSSNKKKTHIVVVPYSKGLSDSFINACGNHEIQIYFKGGKTIKDLLLATKNKNWIIQKFGMIYRFKCDREECDKEYIGESLQTFGERFKVHLMATTIIDDHWNITGHPSTVGNLN